MIFVKKITPPDFQAKNFTPLISPNFNSFGDNNTKTWVKMEKFTPLAKILHCRRQWRQWQISPLGAHTRMTIGGPTLGESQSPRDFRGPTIYGLDEAKRREWIANFLQNLLALWRDCRPLNAIARWGNRGDKDPWWQDTSAFAATTLVQPDGKKLWNSEMEYFFSATL